MKGIHEPDKSATPRRSARAIICVVATFCAPFVESEAPVVHPVTCSTREDHQRRTACFKTMLGMRGKRLVYLSRRNAAVSEVRIEGNLHQKNNFHM